MEPLSRNKKIGILSLVVLSLTLVGLFGTGKLSFSGLKSDVLNQTCTEQGQKKKLPQYTAFLTKRDQAQKILDIASGEIVVLNKKIAEHKDTIEKKQAQIAEKNAKIDELTAYIEKSCKKPQGTKAIELCQKKKQQKRDLGQDVQILKNSIATVKNTILQLSQKIQNNKKIISEQAQLIARYTLFINQYEACDRQLNAQPILTSPFMSGEAHISGEVLVSGEVKMSGEVVIIGKTLVSGEVLISGETCVSGEVRVPLYRLAVTQSYPAKASIDWIDFNMAFGNPDTIKLTDLYVTEEGQSAPLYKCFFLDQNQTQLNCLPGIGGVVNSETRNYILSAKVTSITGPGSLKVYGANIAYNGKKTNAINQTASIKIHYAPKPVKTEIQYVSQFGTHSNALSYALALDSVGNIFISSNSYILKMDASGKYLMDFGNSDVNRLNIVADIATDTNNNIYAVDSDNHRIQKYDSNGRFLIGFGTKGNKDGQFYFPKSIDVDNSGNIYVLDSGNNRVQKFNASGKFLMKFGTEGFNDGQFNIPRSISIDNIGYIYIADGGNNRVQKFDASGKFLMKFGTEGFNDGQFSIPQSIDVDNSGNIYVLDSDVYRFKGGVHSNRVQKFDASGKFLMKFGTYGSGNGQFAGPLDIKIDKYDNIYVLDSGNKRIQKFAQVAVCENKIVTDFELKRLAPWSEFEPNDLEASKYLFGIELCVHGPLNVNELKKTIPGLKNGLPWGYTIIGPNGVVSSHVSAMGGYVEEIKNGQCTRMGLIIQPGDQPAFDKAQKIVFALDYNNVVKEINETNNAKELSLQQATCTDSDGGKNIYTKGTIKGIRADGSTYENSDSCDADLNNLQEMFCKDGVDWGGGFDCPNGCKEGACVQSVTYSVTYNANGATSGIVPVSQVKTHDENLVIAPNFGNLIKTGYTFAGWNTAADGSGTNYAPGASYTTNASVTLYARWIPTGMSCTDSDGGKNEFKFGSITLNGVSGKEDQCMPDGKSVTEYYCKDAQTYGGSLQIPCVNGCTKGACIATDSTPPIITSLMIPATSSTTKVPLSITASESPVSYLMINGPTPKDGLVSALPPKPLPNDTRWSSSIPTSYTFSGIGSRTLFAWVKDIAGNVSDHRSAIVTINQCPEIMPPVCREGEVLVPQTGTSPNGCPLPPVCALPTNVCPVYPPLPENWCRGTLLPLPKDKNGCELPPVCIL